MHYYGSFTLNITAVSTQRVPKIMEHGGMRATEPVPRVLQNGGSSDERGVVSTSGKMVFVIDSFTSTNVTL